VVKTKGKDDNERTLGLVEVEGRELNAAMLEQGWAWHFKRFDQDEKLAKLEEAAAQSEEGAMGG
jgi:endonuclease YncB( thermonuclease family)